MLHIFPLNDLGEHDTESETCICEPKIEFLSNGDGLVIHNSFDGREALEMANYILANKKGS